MSMRSKTSLLRLKEDKLLLDFVCHLLAPISQVRRERICNFALNILKALDKKKGSLIEE
jgi:hypothetical protein